MPQELTPQDAQAAAARLHANVGMQHVGSVYAEAILEAAEAAGRTEALLDEFRRDSDRCSGSLSRVGEDPRLRPGGPRGEVGVVGSRLRDGVVAVVV